VHLDPPETNSAHCGDPPYAPIRRDAPVSSVSFLKAAPFFLCFQNTASIEESKKSSAFNPPPKKQTFGEASPPPAFAPSQSPHLYPRSNTTSQRKGMMMCDVNCECKSQGSTQLQAKATTCAKGAVGKKGAVRKKGKKGKA